MLLPDFLVVSLLDVVVPFMSMNTYKAAGVVLRYITYKIYFKLININNNNIFIHINNILLSANELI